MTREWERKQQLVLRLLSSKDNRVRSQGEEGMQFLARTRSSARETLDRIRRDQPQLWEHDEVRRAAVQLEGFLRNPGWRNEAGVETSSLRSRARAPTSPSRSPGMGRLPVFTETNPFKTPERRAKSLASSPIDAVDRMSVVNTSVVRGNMDAFPKSSAINIPNASPPSGRHATSDPSMFSPSSWIMMKEVVSTGWWDKLGRPKTGALSSSTIQVLVPYHPQLGDLGKVTYTFDLHVCDRKIFRMQHRFSALKKRYGAIKLVCSSLGITIPKFPSNHISERVRGDDPAFIKKRTKELHAFLTVLFNIEDGKGRLVGNDQFHAALRLDQVAIPALCRVAAERDSAAAEDWMEAQRIAATSPVMFPHRPLELLLPALQSIKSTPDPLPHFKNVSMAAPDGRIWFQDERKIVDDRLHISIFDMDARPLWIVRSNSTHTAFRHTILRVKSDQSEDSPWSTEPSSGPLEVVEALGIKMYWEAGARFEVQVYVKFYLPCHISCLPLRL